MSEFLHFKNSRMLSRVRQQVLQDSVLGTQLQHLSSPFSNTEAEGETLRFPSHLPAGKSHILAQETCVETTGQHFPFQVKR